MIATIFVVCECEARFLPVRVEFTEEFTMIESKCPNCLTDFALGGQSVKFQVPSDLRDL